MSGEPREKIVYKKMASQFRKQLDEQDFLKAWQAGRSMHVETVLDLLTSLIRALSTPRPKTLPVPSNEDHQVILSEREMEVLHQSLKADKQYFCSLPSG